MKQAVNPYLPQFEYVPDGEPHVFGDRLYIYGSHDRFGGKEFCMNDYVCYSAPVSDLTDWRYEGVIYTRTQDPRMADGKHYLWAPDVVQGKDGRYYLVYSSVSLHELCYAVSDHPDRGFRYGGVIVSNCDLFPGRNGKPVNCYGNNHGGLEKVNGKYYIFYQRHTNRTMFSRQGCAEEVRISEDGKITQAELTSCGLNGGPLEGKGTYPAGICCQLYGKHTPTISMPYRMFRFHPYLTQDGPDRSSA